MVVIGFDPGSISFGLGILKLEDKRILFLHAEEIKLKEKDFYNRMKSLWIRLTEIYAGFPIQQAAIEEGFLGKDVRAMSTLAKVRGLVTASLIDRNIPLSSYSPRQVKLALSGSGSAPKPQLGKILRMILDIRDREFGNDESDALAVAYCHALHIR
jgi:crossover junction endodeoxyribonuclease RuvC